jgi:prepilin-type processing-associated H-X9-DG protein
LPNNSPTSTGRDGYPYWNRGNGPPAYGEYWIAGSVNFGIARSISEGAGSTNFTGGNPPALGSWHAGVCNFLFGDGSVQSLSTALNINTLKSLGSRNDGQVVSIDF